MGAHSFLRRLCAVILGLTLFVGGVLKAADPVGSTLVVDSYLNFFNLGFLKFASSIIAFGLNVVECILGAALISGAFPLIAGTLSGVMMGVYTIITLILLIANPVMDCGCFGEAVHLTHLQSFLKNIVLDLLWAVMYFPARFQVRPHLRRYASFAVVVVASVAFSIYSLSRLPVLDLTDLRCGTEVEEGRIPLLGSDGEYHDEVALEGNVLMISVYDPEKLSEKAMERIHEERKVARAAGYRPVVVFAGDGGVYSSDRKTLLSLNRSNGGATIIVNGQVVRKFANDDLPTSAMMAQIAERDPSDVVAEDIAKGRRTIGVGALAAIVILLI